jgi:hypothetical protein
MPFPLRLERQGDIIYVLWSNGKRSIHGYSKSIHATAKIINVRKGKDGRRKHYRRAPRRK